MPVSRGLRGIPGLLVYQDQLVPSVSPGQRDRLVSLEYKALLDRQDLQDPSDLLDLPDSPDLPVPRDLMGQ